ncbi:MAG: Hsp20/alpha crystallin family protein [Desulfurococcales archaeon]|nr:Hsp20/alpha crystallin family protein [Desulfurococcales archaeon]MCE4605589.1 Hsp20/alpha crystallin family protein [Desulfurococcales archaeon]
MSWFRRRRSIFDVFDEIMREFEEEIREIEEEFMKFVREGRTEVRGPYYYGVRVTIGPDGVPRVEEFGNIRRRAGRPVITDEIEPMVDVLDYDNEVVVVAELPGVDRDKIKVKVKDNKLIIKAEKPENKKKYYKEIELPAKVKPETAKASYKNGVLEVRIEKEKKEEEDGGVEIKVE